MLKNIIQNLTNESPDDVLVSEFNLTIRKRDLLTLKDQNWLNDEINNFYMNLLVKRSSRNEFPNIHTMSTFFYPKFRDHGFPSIRKWTKNVDIFSKDIVVVPIHLVNYWCLSIIDFRDKSIRFYDSMTSHDEEGLVSYFS